MLFNDSRLQNRDNNFDLLRLLASLLILVGHAPLILRVKYVDFDPFEPVFGHAMHAFSLVVFFVISGFLVARSWEKRPSISAFLRARVLRIYPGLIVAIVLFVCVLGPLLTNLALSDYFSSALTYKYLVNATLVRITYVLPGVFTENPIGPSINGSLWSLPYEFFCYFIVLFTGLLLRIKGVKFIYPILLVVCTVIYSLFEQQLNAFDIPVLALRIRVLAPFLLYFLAGASLFELRHLIPWHWSGAVLVITFGVVLRYFGWSDYLNVIPLSYFILYFACIAPRFPFDIQKVGDLSFGIFLYSFPIQQLLVHFWPSLDNLTLYIFLTIVLVLPLAFLSWRFVEKPMLKLKGKR